jgi:hypothetical protein
MHEIVFTLAAEVEWFNFVRLHGDRFDKPFDRTLRLLRQNPAMGIALREVPLRRILISRTVWAIYYGVAGNRVVISTILDLRQDPRQIEKRLRELLP